MSAINLFLLRITVLVLIGRGHCSFPFRNTSLPWADRVNDLVGRLTLEEMVLQMARGGGPNNSPAPAIPRLGIGPYGWATECIRGVVSPDPATSFPQSIGLTAAFSRQVIFNVAEATAIEARAKFYNYSSHGLYRDHMGISCFAPFINIMRHPLWGRNQEVYGEDPYLSGEYAASYVEGLHGNHSRYVRASSGCKVVSVHSGPDNIPTSRFSFDANITERDYRLTYLPNMKRCIEAGTYNLMCSYNSINGIPACANRRLLTDILRGEFGFRGYVVSDEGAIENVMLQHNFTKDPTETAAACVNAGVNLELAGGQPFFLHIGDAVQKGLIANHTVSEMVKPMFYTRMRLGEFDPPEMNPYSNIKLDVIQSREHQELSIESAVKSFVLLKNMDNILPFMKKFNSIAVIGPMADNVEQLYGDYTAPMDPHYTITPRQGLSSLADKLTYAAGCQDNNPCTKYNYNDIRSAVSQVDAVIVCLGTGQIIETEGRDRADMKLPGYQMSLLQDAVKYSNGKPVILLLFTAGPVEVNWAQATDGVSAIIQCFFPAQGTGEALRRVLTMTGPSISNPAGRLPYTWYSKIDQVPPMTDYSMDGRTYRYFKGDPLYPFGYGLSYSNIKYLSMKIVPDMVSVGQNITVIVNFVNTGPYEAEEVTQIYIHWRTTHALMPNLQLVGFQRTGPIAVNQQVTVHFTVTAYQMAVWYDDKGFVDEPGVLNVYAGGQQPIQKVNVGSNTLVQGVKIRQQL